MTAWFAAVVCLALMAWSGNCSSVSFDAHKPLRVVAYAIGGLEFGLAACLFIAAGLLR